MGKNISFWPLDEAKKFFWPATRYELCTPALDRLLMKNIQSLVSELGYCSYLYDRKIRICFNL